MDKEVVAWARRVKARAGLPKMAGLPRLWLFTDPRIPDLPRAIRALPHGLCGVVFRHDRDPDRAALAWRVAKQCHQQGIPLVVAGDWRLAAAVRAGVHLRDGFRQMGFRRAGVRTRLITSSAHSVASLRRARDAGASLVFLSPIFPTSSHPESPALGQVRWARLAGRMPASAPICLAALGGVTGDTIRRLPPGCLALGGISALS